MPQNLFTQLLQRHRPFFSPVVHFDGNNKKMVLLDLSNENKELAERNLTDRQGLQDYVDEQMAGAAFGVGGYLENRQVYGHSLLFNGAAGGSEPRTIHLGVDIWGPVGTTVFAPLAGIVHSFANNAADGDYGATIILQHQLEGFVFHTLYGHLSLADLNGLRPNGFISTGMPLAHFGPPSENGNWPPHLHFQVIIDMQLKQGDYPGVCAISQKASYQKNCPNPEQILQLANYL